MADPRFFSRSGPFKLKHLAEIAEAEMAEGADPEMEVTDVGPLDAAGPSELSFLDNKKYLPALEGSKAGVCILSPRHAKAAPEGMALLLSTKPYRGYARIAARFYPEPPLEPGIHESAVVDPDAKIGEGAVIGPYCVIDAGAEIGDGTRLGAQVHVGRNVRIGGQCRISSQVTLAYCEIGDRVTIHSGCRIGGRGFGFAMDAEGHEDVPQLGRVLIAEDCELGANVTVDRGAAPDTIIGPGCKIDNLVQIGHNVQMGRGCVIVSQAGVAGSTKLGNFVTLAAQAGVAGHLNLGDGSILAAKSGLMSDMAPGETFGGLPAMPLKQYFKLVAMWKRMLGNERG